MTRSLTFVSAALLLSAASFAASASPIASGFNANTLAPNDDGSTSLVNLAFSADFFGVTYSGLYVNNNGNVTFSGPLSNYTPYGLSGSAQSIIAPFFADVDTRGAGSSAVTYGTGTYAGEDAFGVNWTGVGYYFEHSDKLDNFQLIIVDRSDIATGDFDIYFNYGSMQWETGDASGGSGGLGGNCAVAGYSNGLIAGASETTTQLAGSGVCGALIDGGADALSSNTNDGVTGQYLFEARNGEIITPPTTGVTPEPGSLLLVATGLAGAAAGLRRRFTASF